MTKVGRITFSPGPWHTQPDSTFSTLGDKRIIAYNNISPAIAFGGLGEETDANARLIAAAPELLAALKALVLEVELKDNPSDEGASSDCDQMDAARAAISKAEGKP